MSPFFSVFQIESKSLPLSLSLSLSLSLALFDARATNPSLPKQRDNNKKKPTPRSTLSGGEVVAKHHLLETMAESVYNLIPRTVAQEASPAR